MNKKILVSAMVALFLSPMTGVVADTATDDQTVTVTVPAVKLLDIKSASGTSTVADEADALSFTLVAPTVAGDNFAAVTHGTGGFYDITSNVASGTSQTRTLSVSADTIGEGWKLDITPTAVTGGSASAVSLTNSTTTGNLVTGIGNVAESDLAIAFTFGPESSSIVPSYTGADGTTGEDIVLTYTLGDDS